MEIEKRAVINAIIKFEETANTLIKKLLTEFNINLKDQYPFSKFLLKENNLQKCKISGHWTYWFHGDACEFLNIETMQVVYVKINRNGNYGVIDNYYLHQFVLTTDSLISASIKIMPYSEFCKILKQLEHEKIIVDISDDDFLKTRVLNHRRLKMM